MGVSLPTDTAIIILAVIAAVYFAITAVLLVCVCCCIWHKRKWRSRVKPKTTYSPRPSKVHNEYDLDSFTSTGGTSRSTSVTEVSSVNTDTVLKITPVTRRTKKRRFAGYSEQEWRDSAILEGVENKMVVSTDLDQFSDDTGTSSSGSTEKVYISTTVDPHTTPEQWQANSQGGSPSVEGSQDEISHIADDDDDNVFEASTTHDTNDVEQRTPSHISDEGKRKKEAQRKRKQRAFRTDSVKPLLNGSESRTQSESSDTGYEPPLDLQQSRSLTQNRELLQLPHTRSSRPFNMPQSNLTPIHSRESSRDLDESWASPASNLNASIVRERPRPSRTSAPLQPPMTVAAVEPTRPVVEDLESSEEDTSLSVL